MDLNHGNASGKMIDPQVITLAVHISTRGSDSRRSMDRPPGMKDVTLTYSNAVFEC